MRIPLNTFMCITETKINRQVLDSLLMAYSSEWYAYNQYWNGALLATGKTREILLEHSKDEMKHLGWIAKRILELGVATNTESTDPGSGAYIKPIKSRLVAQNIKGEEIAIKMYQDLIDLCQDTDKITYELAIKIQSEEIEHREELESIQ